MTGHQISLDGRPGDGDHAGHVESKVALQIAFTRREPHKRTPSPPASSREASAAPLELNIRRWRAAQTGGTTHGAITIRQPSAGIAVATGEHSRRSSGREISDSSANAALEGAGSPSRIAERAATPRRREDALHDATGPQARRVDANHAGRKYGDTCRRPSRFEAGAASTVVAVLWAPPFKVRA